MDRRERYDPYSFENPPESLAAAQKRFTESNRRLVGVEMQLTQKSEGDFAAAEKYDAWYESATYVKLIVEAELRFLSVWMPPRMIAGEK